MNQPLNLLPESYGRVHLIKRRLIQWGFVWCGLAMLAIGLGWHQLRGYRLHGDRLSVITDEAAPFESMRDRTVDMRKRLKDLRLREELVLSLAENRSLLTLFGVVSRAAEETSGNVSVSNLTIVQGERANDDSDDSSDSMSSGQLIIDGTAIDDIAIAAFVNGLRDAGVFQEVQLTSTAPQLVNGFAARGYHLTCTF